MRFFELDLVKKKSYEKDVSLVRLTVAIEVGIAAVYKHKMNHIADKIGSSSHILLSFMKYTIIHAEPTKSMPAFMIGFQS